MTVFFVFPEAGEEEKAANWLDKKCQATRDNPSAIHSVNGYCMCNSNLFGIYLAPDADDCYETMFHEVWHTVLDIMEYLEMDVHKSSEVPALVAGKLCRKIMDVYDTKVAA